MSEPSSRVTVLRTSEDGEPEKCCSLCHEWWPADLEFFYGSKTGRGGVGNWCRACYHERSVLLNAQKVKSCP